MDTETETRTYQQFLLEGLATHKEKREILEAQYTQAEAELIDLLGEASEATVTAVLGTNTLRGTLVQPEVLDVDLDKLKASVTRYRFTRVTKRVVDLPALKASLAAGVIPPKTFKGFTSRRLTKPYIKVTTR